MLRRCKVSLPVFILLFATVAGAQDAAKREKVEELFRVTHLEDNFNQLMDQTLAQSQQMSRGLFDEKQITPADQAKLDSLTKQVTALVQESLSWQQLEPKYITLYADTYSVAELDGILAFYTSPIGQSMLNKTPALLSRSSLIVQEQSAELQPKLRQLMQDFMEQIANEKKEPARSNE
ncbi:MAG TPA: DUF2059 domain-containing protein [Acidobacteriaceae bacterium]